MAGLFCDSFDHYQAADLDAKYTSRNGSTFSILAGQGRCGTSCLDTQVAITKGIPYAGTLAVWGAAVWYPSTSTGDLTFFSFLDGTGPQVQLHRYVDGSIGLLRGAATQIALSLPDVTRQDGWHYIEVECFISATVGTTKVYVDGQTVINFTGNTQGSGTTTITGFSLIGNLNQHCRFDDLYTLDNTGAANNARKGDSRVQYLRPNAPGGMQDFTVVGTGTHWQAVDDGSTPDGDATYVWSATVGQMDTNEYENVALPLGGVIHWVQVSPYARKTDSGLRSIAIETRIAGVNYSGGVVNDLTMTYKYWHDIFQVNPATVVAWTKADLNTAPKAQFGERVAV